MTIEVQYWSAMWALLFFLLAAWVVVSILGLVIKGLFWLFVIGVILFVVTSVLGWSKRDHSRT